MRSDTVEASAELKRLRVAARASERVLRMRRQQDGAQVRQLREKLKLAAKMQRAGKPRSRVLAILTEAEKLVPYQKPARH